MDPTASQLGIQFKRKFTSAGSRQPCFVVTFAREGVIQGRHEGEVQRLVTQHLARAKAHGAIDRVVSAHRLIPRLRCANPESKKVAS